MSSGINFLKTILLYKKDKRFSSKKKGDIFKEIDDEKKSNIELLESIWNEVTQEKNSLDVLIEISLNNDYFAKVSSLKLHRIQILSILTDELQKIVLEKLTSIQNGLSN